MVAPMRLANNRSASGGMASSFAATKNQGGGISKPAHPSRLQGGRGQWLLHGEHDLCLCGINIGREVVDEIVLG